jgi:hypothetical protein
MKEIIQKLRELAGKSQFISFTYTSKGTGEIARHTLIAGANYHNLIEKSKLALELMPISELVQAGVAPDFAEKAKNEILASFDKTLAAHAKGEQNEDYTKRGQYVSLGAGVNLNLNDNSIQFFGLSHAKVIITPGVYKTVNSRPLTIAKDKIRALLPVSKFREFALDVENLQSARIAGETLVIE